MKNLETLQREWYAENLPIGKKCGYPHCCIKEFGRQPPGSFVGKPTKNDLSRFKAGSINNEFTGFIPCVEHAKQIIKGEITLQSLIDYDSRDPSFPLFPFA